MILQWVSSTAVDSSNIINCSNPNTETVQLICGDKIIENHDNCFAFYLRNSVNMFRDDVRTLITGNCKNVSLDSDLLQKFQRLNVFDFSNHGVVDLPHELPNTWDLKVINASRNNLESVPKDLLTQSDSLREIDFSQNKIKMIPKLDLRDSDHLKKINFSENCISTLENGIFSEFRFLEKLDLSKNEISAIDNGVFAQNTYLEQLLLSHNQLKRFECVGLRSLQVVDLAYNAMTQVSCTFFAQNYVNLIELYLEANNFVELIDERRINFEKLSVLHVSGEKIDCTSITQLCIRWNVVECFCNFKQMGILMGDDGGNTSAR